MTAEVVGPSVEGVVVALRLKDATSWWNIVNESPTWQDRIFHFLAALYGIVFVGALVQLVRIQLRVLQYGWTTQKVFHFLNFFVNGSSHLMHLIFSLVCDFYRCYFYMDLLPKEMLCLIVCLVHCVVFAFRRDVHQLNPEFSDKIQEVTKYIEGHKLCALGGGGACPV